MAAAQQQALDAIFELHVTGFHIKYLVAGCSDTASLNTIIYVLQSFSWLANFSHKWTYNQNHPLELEDH